jgi:hypothetical protein
LSFDISGRSAIGIQVQIFIATGLTGDGAVFADNGQLPNLGQPIAYLLLVNQTPTPAIDAGALVE